LLDLVLPDINGHDVLRQLRVARLDKPILILSGETDTENKIRGFSSGADDYLTKPVPLGGVDCAYSRHHSPVKMIFPIDH